MELGSVLVVETELESEVALESKLGEVKDCGWESKSGHAWDWE